MPILEICTASVCALFSASKDATGRGEDRARFVLRTDCQPEEMRVGVGRCNGSRSLGGHR